MAISRLQLAAALLEYDNADEDPYQSKVSHRDSALFRPYQPRPLDSVPIQQQHSPSNRNIQYDPRYQQRPQSQQFAPDRAVSYHDQRRVEGNDQREELSQDVLGGSALDLDRWDLPQHLLSPASSQPPIRVSSAGEENRLAEQMRFRQLPPLRSGGPSLTPQPIISPLSERTNSIHLDVLDGIPAETSEHGTKGYDAYDGAQEALARAQRVQMMYDDQNRHPTLVPLPPSPASALNSFRPSSALSADMLGGRSACRPMSAMSESNFDAMGREGMARPQTSMSRNSYDALRSPVGHQGRPGSAYGMMDEREEEEEVLSPNPFALPAPSVEHGSRFDPKAIESQRRSMDEGRPLSRISTAASTSRPYPMQHNPSSSLTEAHLHQYTGDRHTGDPSDAFHGREIKTFADIPTAAEYGKPLRPSKYGPLPPIDRRSLLRPRTIIIPTPLSAIPPPDSPPRNVPDGYTLGAKPLPPGSRSSILTTDGRCRPGLPMSVSQKTFRSSLVVGGRREDEEYWVGGATEDGEIGVEYAGEGDTQGPTDRRPGKLYGKSLIDQLEARKTAMKGKQRAFTGDSRPAMMARGDQPARPVSMMAPTTRQPLLTMNSSGDVDFTDPALASGEQTLNVKDRMTKSKSVFGVDTIWEKEMAKLKIIQEAEAEAAALKAAKEALEAKMKAKKKAKKLSTQKPPWELQLDDDQPSADYLEHPEPVYGVSPVDRMPSLPPQLAYSPDKAIHMPVPHDAPRLRAEVQGGADAWSDSDDDTPRPKAKTKGKARADPAESDSDSEEDVPLSRLAKPTAGVRRGGRAGRTMESGSESDSEEDVPLSKFRLPSVPAALASLAPLALPVDDLGTGSLGLDTQASDGAPAQERQRDIHPEGEDEDDDVPLMLRINPGAAEVEDDLPLGYKHADAVQRQHAEAWRASMTSPQYPMPMQGMQGMQGMPGMQGMQGMAMPGQWGYQDPSMGMMSPYMPSYPSGYDMPGMGMQWPSGHMGMPDPVAMGMAMGSRMDMPPMPPHASKNIDSWRKEVAVSPVTGEGSVA